ncbi:MAG TPA: hypothetical protein VGE96_00480 [Steroidobacteraceae bacterium]
MTTPTKRDQTVETDGYRQRTNADVTDVEVLARTAEAEVYRVRAGTVRQWDVYQEPSSVPIASFDDKASALNYAMCLARGRVAWHLLLRPATAPPRNRNARETAPTVRRH